MVENSISQPVLSKRIVSLDALRGFIMFSMLIGTFGLQELSHYPILGFIYNQLNHAPWVGFHFEDIILPAFLFIIGVSISISDSNRRLHGENSKKRFAHAIKRSVTLFCMGFLLSWISAGKPYFGAGVLQVLAISYFCGYFFIGTNIRIQFIIFTALLFVYWFFIFIIPVPEAGRNSYILYKNLVYYLDDILTGSATRWGYLYTLITSTAVVVYGSIVGKLLIARTSNKQFLKTLGIIGIVGVLIGLALHPFIPIIKRMFTPSYTMLTCGLASLMFLVFYWFIDVKKYSKWSLLFIIFGMNSLFIYMINGLFMEWLLGTERIFIDPLAGMIGEWVSPVEHCVRILLEWLLCLWLYRKKIFIKL